MEVVVASHPSSLKHDTGPRHPERPDRVHAAHRGVLASGLEVVEIEAPRIDPVELALVHDASYIEMIKTLSSVGGGALDMDTVVSERTWEAALTAAGAVRVLVEELENKTDCTGFAITRPPGHHANVDRAMGFCIFNNVAISAALVRTRGDRVAIVDWDVHHGNGTQAMLGDDPGVLYFSIHQDHFYPYEGHLADIEVGDAPGTNINIPIPAGTSGDVYRRAWGELVIPVVSAFAPDWVFVSAGYDGHVDDPLGGLSLVADDYGWLAARLADVQPANRTILALEGGYDLDAIDQSIAATLKGLAGRVEDIAGQLVSPPGASVAVDEAAVVISRHWPV